MEHFYKAKQLDPPEWVEGNLVIVKEGEFSKRAFLIPMESQDNCFYAEKEAAGFQIWYSIDSDTICKWTGMVDRDGEKIWEYDLVEYPFGSQFLIYWNTVQCAYYGILLQQKNRKPVRGCFPLGALRCPKPKRIGSIFENPLIQRRWLAYFSKLVSYPVSKNR